jgi:beta-glucosidase-like glycosyl hydrolase
MGRLTLTEKIAMISPQPQLGEICGDHTAGKASIGLPPYFWLVETNTNVASSCFGPDRCATTFSGPLGMAASFNRTNWHLKGLVLGTEMRAFSNAGWPRGTSPQDLIALTAYGPNINIARDPRFGRTSELPGEDPFLNGQYAKHMVQGMQTEDAGGHPMILAYLKHFTAYSRETDRGHDSYQISTHDLFETYLAQYEIGFVEGRATGAMCSYNAENGVPSCANNFILNKVRENSENFIFYCR